MAFASTYTSAQQGAADRVAAYFLSLGERMRKNREFRQTVNELQALSNRELADLGLNRSMVKRVAYQAVYED